LAHEVFEGRRQDRTTLGEMLDRLGERVGLSPGQTVVVDRGMAFEENLEEIRSRDLHYLVASRQPERDQWLAEYEGVEGFEEVRRSPSPRNPCQKKTKIWVKKASGDGETHVLCISEERIEKDRAIREKHEERLLRDLEKLAKRIALGRLVNEKPIWEAIGRLKERYPRVARYYRIEYDRQLKQLRYEENEEKKWKAEKLDGAYLLKTDRPDFTADEVWRIYSLLTRVESAFRAMKSPLAERPIFHQLQRRVETHIFLCVLAYHLLVAIENTLLGQGMHTSWATVREMLRTHQIATVVLPTDKGSVLRIRRGSRAEPQHAELYDLLRVPHDIMAPVKTWTESWV
jgi:transposase